MDHTDLGSAADRITKLLAHVGDDQLDAPTPCPDYRVGDLIEHIGGLAPAFANAASKGGGPMAELSGSGDSTRLAADWRDQIPAALSRLAASWRDPSAWNGMTRVGGIDLPGEIAGAVALDELVLHGWDLARAIGRDYDAGDDEIEACIGFVAPTAEPGQEAMRQGIFGPVVDVPADAPRLHQLLGLAGRDPSWAPPAR